MFDAPPRPQQEHCGPQQRSAAAGQRAATTAKARAHTVSGGTITVKKKATTGLKLKAVQTKTD